jgi:hypothetical protein
MGRERAPSVYSVCSLSFVRVNRAWAARGDHQDLAPLELIESISYSGKESLRRGATAALAPVCRRPRFVGYSTADVLTCIAFGCVTPRFGPKQPDCAFPCSRRCTLELAGYPVRGCACAEPSGRRRQSHKSDHPSGRMIYRGVELAGWSRLSLLARRSLSCMEGV